MAEQPAIELLARPVVALDGTVYRFHRLRRVECDDCSWAAWCERIVGGKEPLPCEEAIEPEITGEGWMARSRYDD